MTKTTASLPTNCTECGTKLNSKNRSSSPTNNANVTSDIDDACTKCYDYWGWENEHSDDDHANNAHTDCPVCLKEFPQLRMARPRPEAPTGRTNTSHANCAHPRTPAGRAACRKIRDHA